MSILVATDFSEGSAPALLTATMLAERLKVPLRMLHVVDFAGDDNAWRILYETPEEIETHARQQAQVELVAFYENVIPSDQRADYTSVVRFGTPGDGIVAEAKADPPDFIVAGTTGHSRLQHVFFGRTSNHLVRDAAVPVLAVPPNFEASEFKKILVAIDFSECSDRALRLAAQFAGVFDGHVEVLHAVDVNSQPASVSLSALVGDIGPALDDLLETRSQQLKTWVKKLDLDIEVQAYHLEGDRADAAIVKRSDKGEFDLIVMGTHGRRGFARWFLGSTAERVLRHTHRPVLVVSAPSTD